MKVAVNMHNNPCRKRYFSFAPIIAASALTAGAFILIHTGCGELTEAEPSPELPDNPSPEDDDKDYQEYRLLFNPYSKVCIPDGICLGALAGSLEEGLELTIRRVSNPSDYEPFPFFMTIDNTVGDFYSVSAEYDYCSPIISYFLVGLPVPENVSKDRLSLAIRTSEIAPHISYNEETGFNDTMLWDFQRGQYSPDYDLFGTMQQCLYMQETIYVLVEEIGPYPKHLNKSRDGQ